MKKIVFMFPGVGSQYVGMCKSLYDHYAVFRQTVEEAGEILELDLKKICWDPGDKGELNKLNNAQPILVAFGIAAYRVFSEEVGSTPHYMMGHSLGEYSALCAAGVMDLAAALELVRKRSQVIDRVSASLEGTMAWVVNLDNSVVERVCQEVSAKGQGKVYVSAYDCPTQSSISGHKETLMTAARELENHGAIVYPLQMSGPFHSPLMAEAAEEMRAVLASYTFKPPTCTVIANHNGLPYKGDADAAIDIVENLSLQLISPIRWQASLQYLLERGVGLGVEMGPKNVLKFLVQKITPHIHTFTTDKLADIETAQKQMVVAREEYLDLIGKTLGAAVATKNRSDRHDEYGEKVVAVYRGIETTYKDCLDGKRSPSLEDLRQAAAMLDHIFTFKEVPLEERRLWFNRVWGNKVLDLK